MAVAGPSAGSQPLARILAGMHAHHRNVVPALLPSFACVLALLAAGCDDRNAPAGAAAVPGSGEPPPAPAVEAATAAGPDTSDLGPIVLARINANPGVNGTATLVEFRQTSVTTEALGDTMRSAVVEFEGVVTFSSDVSWSWQGPTRAGAPQKFEARAEYFDQGDGWQRVEPLGIYPL